MRPFPLKNLAFSSVGFPRTVTHKNHNVLLIAVLEKTCLVPNLTFFCEMRHQTTTTVSYMVYNFSNENNVDATSLFFGTKYKNNKNGVMET